MDAGRATTERIGEDTILEALLESLECPDTSERSDVRRLPDGWRRRRGSPREILEARGGGRGVPSTCAAGALRSHQVRQAHRRRRRERLPTAALVVPASTHETRASELMPAHLYRQGVAERLELVLVDRGVTAGAVRSPVENTTTSATGWLQVACIATTLRHLTRGQPRRRAWTLAARPAADAKRGMRQIGVVDRDPQRHGERQAGRPAPMTYRLDVMTEGRDYDHAP